MLWVLIAFLAVLAVYNFYWKRRQLPPGPTPLPLLGNVLDIHKLPYPALLKWRKQYGPVYTYWLSEHPIVVVADYETMQETFVKDGDSYAGRNFFNEAFRIIRGCNYGIVFSEGDLWRENRRLGLRLLRDYGMSRTVMESKILLEVSELVAGVKADLKKGVIEHDLIAHVDFAVGSIINQMLFGHRIEGECKAAFVEINKTLYDALVDMARLPCLVSLMWPAARHLPFFSTAFDDMQTKFRALLTFLDRRVEEYEKDFDPLENSEEPLPFVGGFLKAKAHAGLQEESFPEHMFSKDALRCFLFDLWIAGQETTTNTLSFGILYLLLDQEAQEKLQQELDNVVGSDRWVTLADRPNLHYANAVVQETQRLSNLVPQNLMRRTTRDVEINGHKIAAGTTIVPQISCVLFDEKIFPDPLKFHPERFLDDDGHYRKVEENIPFSLGKRQCVGESLARMELFLLIANIFNQFKVLPVDPLNPPTSEKVNASTVRPVPFKARMRPRYHY